MITINNYTDQTKSVQFHTLPEALQKGNQFFVKATDNGNNLSSYSGSEGIKKAIDLYLSKLNEFVSNNLKADKKKTNAGQTKIANDEVIKEATKRQGITKPAKPGKVSNPVAEDVLFTERIPDELRFIKRFLNLNGKTKLKEDILRFINSLQKAIVEKKIRKSSPYAEQVKFIQGRLIETYNTMKAKIKIELKPETFDAMKKLTGEEKVMPSINFIKRYIGMNGKPGMKQKAKQLLEQINKAYEKGKITDSDSYIVEMHELKKNLKSFIITASQKTLKIEEATLNGLEGVLGCTCTELNGIPDVMNSMDFANMKFDTIGLQGKWLELIGDPSGNFTAMVYGKPKMGKSYLCIDFAGYLARNHGKVLYVAKEEGLDYTLQMKLNDKHVKHPNLYVASLLPDDLSLYNFIFIDSVNRLGLKPEDLNRLRAANPSRSFIFIFQSTKEGKFRGENSFQHDVDVVIEVPEKGKAVQMGRFNQGGEIAIF